MKKRLINNLSKTALLAIFTLIASAVSISAATFTVTNTNDSGAGSLRQAIEDAKAAAGADTVVFDATFNTPQTIQLASSIPNYNSADPLTITGPGANLLTIRGTGNNNERIFTLFFQTTVNANSEVSLSGMTISNGKDTFFGGGGIFVQFGKVSLTNVTVTANSGSDGGGIALYNGSTLTAVDSTISSNTVTGGGGGIYAIQSSTINLTNTTVSGNNALDGGGFTDDGSSTVTVNGSTITNNTAMNFGGGVSIGGTLTINNSNILNNTSTNQAGGVGIFGSGISLTVTNSTMSGNTTGREGGGLLATSGAVTITGSTFSNNSVTSENTHGGGGIAFFNVTATITNSTISGNTSIGNGGGLRNSNSTLTLTNTTVANNSTTANGGGINSIPGSTINLRNSLIANNSATNSGPDLVGLITSQGYNLIENATSATITGNTATNITGQDPLLGPLQANGGLTFTHALLMGSPAIDAADPANFPATDQRGNLRPADGDNNGSALPDIGAFEVGGTTAANATISGRVITNGRGIANVFVSLTDVQGNIRYARTNPFGYFRFNDIPVGQTYIAEINSKQYVFSPQVISVDENITNLNFSPITQTFTRKGQMITTDNHKFLQRK